MQKIAILLPTRERPKDFKLCADSWVKYTEGFSDVIVRTDYDDSSVDAMCDEYGFIHEKGERKPFLQILNDLALKYIEYDYIAFLEDDCVFMDKWESTFINKLDELKADKGFGIVWCNDNINKDALVGLPTMTSSIIKALGYMTPPEINYLWADYFWLHIGGALNCLHYFPDLMIEHRHYSTGKRELCKISVAVDTNARSDAAGYDRYRNTYRFQEDVKKCLDYVG
jgi:hypothetical protein